MLRLGVSSLPELPRDMSDRNRTSPFAFTGNKFEFRAVASSQSIAYPAAFLNLIVAESLDHICDKLEQAGGASAENIQETVRAVLKEHQRILFAGDNYAPEWKQEAARRGLLDRTSTPESLADLLDEKNIELYERYGVLSANEVRSRFKILNEKYSNTINVEAIATRDIAMTMILPAAMAHQRQLAESITAVGAVLGAESVEAQNEVLAVTTRAVSDMKKAIDHLLAAQEELEGAELSEDERARAYRDRIIPAMDAVRVAADLLERLVDDDLWPLPKYREMLFIH